MRNDEIDLCLRCSGGKTRDPSVGYPADESGGYPADG